MTLYGYRMWVPGIDNFNNKPILHSLVAPVVWEDPVLEAQELSTSLIDYEPHWGIHSFNTPESLFEYTDWKENGSLILGVIAPFGLTYFHEKGFRSAKAQIVALCNYLLCERCDKQAAVLWRWDLLCPNRHNMNTYALCDFHSGSRFVSDPHYFISVQDFLTALSKRYQCDIVSLNEFMYMEDEDGIR